MWRPIRKHYKVVLVWGVVCLLTFDTATACRFLARRRCCRSQCAVVVCEPTCGQAVVADCCDSGAIVTDKGQTAPQVIDDQIPVAPTPAEPMSPGDTPMPVESTPMQEQPMDTPAAKPMEDMPPQMPPVNEPPMVEQPAVPAAPAPGEQKAPADDLFGDKPAEAPAAKPAAPAEKTPAPKAAIDDLFGDTPMPANPPAAPPANPPAAAPAEAPAPKTADDLFGEPAAAPAQPANPPAAKPAETVDDLFGGETKPAAPPAPANEAKKPVDDPFGARIDMKDELLVMRKWVDNTGGFTVTGRLIEIQDGKVRLLKDTGKTCTVPIRRLSTADAQYVQMIVSKLGTGQLIQLASR